MNNTEIIPPASTPTLPDLAPVDAISSSAGAPQVVSPDAVVPDVDLVGVMDPVQAAQLKQLALEGGGIDQYALPPLIPPSNPNANSDWLSRLLKWLQSNLPGFESTPISIDWIFIARLFLLIAILALLYVIIRVTLRARARQKTKGQKIETRRVPELWMERELQIALAEQDFARALRVRWVLHLHRARVSPDLTPSERARFTKSSTLESRVADLDRSMFDTSQRPTADQARDLLQFLDSLEGSERGA